MVSNHPQYGRGPSQPQIWKTDHKAPTHQPTPKFQPLNSGSTMDFNRPWGGDPESQSPTTDKLGSFLQRNLGNYLLYRAAIHGGANNDVDEIEQNNAGLGEEHGPTRDDLHNIHKNGLSNPQLALPAAPVPRPHGPGPDPEPYRPAGPMGARAKGRMSTDARTQHGGRGPGQPPIPKPMGLDKSWNSRQGRTGMNPKNKPLDRDDYDDTNPWF